ncbi:unnamed protein product, partial [Urochloa humidicola]
VGPTSHPHSLCSVQFLPSPSVSAAAMASASSEPPTLPFPTHRALLASRHHPAPAPSWDFPFPARDPERGSHGRGDSARTRRRQEVPASCCIRAEEDACRWGSGNGSEAHQPVSPEVIFSRGALLWDDRPRPPAPNPWASSLFFSLKNDGGSGSFGNINDHPSFGSSRMSTDGSDLLDSSLAWGQTSHNSTTAKSHPQSTELTSGSGQLPHSQTSFLDVLKAQLKTSTSRVCTRYSIHDVSCYGKYSSGSITFRKHLLVGAYQDC